MTFAVHRLAGLTGLLIALATSPAVQAADAAAAEAKPDLARGQTVAQVCAACHSHDGSRGAPANPIIAGQHPEYLVTQLQHFKSGVRNNAIMRGFASTLSDADMKNVAAFYASKQAKPGAAKDKELVVLGESIWRGGIPDRKIAACSGCHSPNGAGIPVQYPRIAGQHAEYTEAQLLNFRSGARVNLQMNAVASKMNDREIKAVSDFAAGLR
jgi:cytochrome c553